METQWTSVSYHLPGPSSFSRSFPAAPHICLHPTPGCYSESQTWQAGHVLHRQQLEGTRQEQCLSLSNEHSIRCQTQTHSPATDLLPAELGFLRKHELETAPQLDLSRCEAKPRPSLGKLALAISPQGILAKIVVTSSSTFPEDKALTI